MEPNLVIESKSNLVLWDRSFESSNRFYGIESSKHRIFSMGSNLRVIESSNLVRKVGNFFKTRVLMNVKEISKERVP